MHHVLCVDSPTASSKVAVILYIQFVLYVCKCVIVNPFQVRSFECADF